MSDEQPHWREHSVDVPRGSCYCVSCAHPAQAEQTTRDVVAEQWLSAKKPIEAPLCAMCREPTTLTAIVVFERYICDKCVSAFKHLTLSDLATFCKRLGRKSTDV